MTQTEALRLALEALEANHFLIHGNETKGGLAFCMDGYYSGCFDIDSNDKQTNEAITAIKEALAQPEHCSDCGQKLGDANHIHTCSPQRTWVGLTADEMESLYQQATYMDDTDHIHRLMMAEAKLKEKNT